MKKTHSTFTREPNTPCFPFHLRPLPGSEPCAAPCPQPCPAAPLTSCCHPAGTPVPTFAPQRGPKTSHSLASRWAQLRTGRAGGQTPAPGAVCPVPTPTLTSPKFLLPALFSSERCQHSQKHQVILYFRTDFIFLFVLENHNPMLHYEYLYLSIMYLYSKHSILMYL